MPGYWLCHSGDQCILSGVSIADVNMSSLCDGKLDCNDWSDESFTECVKVRQFICHVTVLFMFLGVLLWNNTHSDHTCCHYIDSTLSPIHYKTSNLDYQVLWKIKTPWHAYKSYTYERGKSINIKNYIKLCLRISFFQLKRIKNYK